MSGIGMDNVGVFFSDNTVQTTAYVKPKTDKAIFGYGYNGSYLSLFNTVSNVGSVSADVAGVGTARYVLAGTGF